MHIVRSEDFFPNPNLLNSIDYFRIGRVRPSSIFLQCIRKIRRATSFRLNRPEISASLIGLYKATTPVCIPNSQEAPPGHPNILTE